ncbi:MULTISPECIES: DUF423 domain-containing protein [Photobacterium]|uniref:Membrane protein n=1 Tax=Photobacterium halotolerans TaxID=265726 RepID=A0A0F5V9N6_9GAMM|nr:MULTISPECIES: DUF423 domain-containing protein [Photobacterium]KKC98486.1 membrane protein [Photobacterium halotolerans]UIP28489.1 DUF423 domain-containing protein [Photobacterium sp. TLY01]
MQSRSMIIFAAISGAIGVGFGAFAAHGLKGHLSPYLLDVFQTGVDYQLWHSLALFGCGIWARNFSAKALSYAALLFAVGICLFSGSLYLLALTGMKWLGPVTPLGGLCFILAWLSLAVAAWRSA